MMTIEIRSEVLMFAKVMEKKLRRNDHKGHWKNGGYEDFQWFVDRLKEEVEELEEALDSRIPEDIADEAADVANYAMMIMDIFSRGGKAVDTCNHKLERPEGEGIPGQVCSEGCSRKRTGDASGGDVAEGS